MSLSNLKDNKTVADHRAMVKAIASNDEQAAMASMELHLSRYKVDKQTIQLEHPEYFKEPI
jgi:DNA-binding GntR family transcriptional regulator